MENNIIANAEKCCGCGICAIICPKKAIEMCPDDMGFLYPQINTEKCVNCGLCIRKCRFKYRIKDKDMI